MPDIVSLHATDVFPVVRSGDTTNYSATPVEITSFVIGNAGISAGLVISNGTAIVAGTVGSGLTLSAGGTLSATGGGGGSSSLVAGNSLAG